MLSIASHHRDYRTHNSLTIHNCRVVSRHLPAPPEQRLLASASGTRVVVRDLFGSMPVRVKQRAIEVERAGTSKDFDQLIFNIIALLLPWPGEVTVLVQDSYAHRTVSLRASGVVDWSLSYRSTAPEMLSRTTALLAQASMVDNDDLKSWVPIGATTSGVSVRGCVSLHPVATRRVQFIALGIRPLLNEHHVNLFYENFNRVFENSSFGVLEEARFDEDGLPTKTQGFTGKELKPKRGIDRWPMFFLQIKLDTGMDLVHIDEFLDQGHRTIAAIADLLQVMAYEFLKKHHFRPGSISAIERLRRPKSNSPAPSPQPPRASSSGNRQMASAVGHSRLKPGFRRQIASPRSRIEGADNKRSASPFTSWSRTKSGVELSPGAKGSVVSHQPVQQASDGSELKCDSASIVPKTASGLMAPLFDKSGALLRKPFDDVEEASATPRNDLPGRPLPDVRTATETRDERETVVWVDPITKLKSIIDPRTGFAVKARPAEIVAPPCLTVRKGPEAVPRPLHWKSRTGCGKNTLFQTTESRIPQVLQPSGTIGCKHGGHRYDPGGEGSDGNMLSTLEGRISKTALQKAHVLAQVDRKFILVKVVTEPPASSSRGFESDDLLVLIDQHAADERCKVEDLFKSYFTPDPPGTGQLVAHTQTLDKPLHFDLASQDGELLVRFKSHFAHWGILYGIPQDKDKLRKDVTVDVHSLPPSILERCRLEPRLLVDMLRKEIWKLHAKRSVGVRGLLGASAAGDWVSRFHDCPEGILDLIHSRACRSRLPASEQLAET